MNMQSTQREELMQTEESRRRRIKVYGVFALGVVPISTLLLAFQGDLIEMSLSRLGNRPGCYGRFVLWGIVCTCSLFILFLKTFDMAQYASVVGKVVMTAACASFLTCVLLPFVPDKHPRAAKWHNELAFLAALLTVAASLLLSLHLRKIDRKLHHIAMAQWAANFVVCFLLLKTTGVTSLLESLYIISTSTHTYGVMAGLEKRASLFREEEGILIEAS